MAIESSSSKAAAVRATIWSVLFIAVCIASVPLLRRVLPQRVELSWQSTVTVSPDAHVSIEAHRRQRGNYSNLQPLDGAQISLDDPRSPHSPIHIGPNDSICMYRDSRGATLRGAAPPDAGYVGTWLKDNGAPDAQAKIVSDRIAQAFDNDQLAGGSPGPDWTMTESSRTNPLAWVATISAMAIIWLAGVGVCVIPRAGNSGS